MTVTIELPQAEGLDPADSVRNLVRKEIAANVHAESQPAQPLQKEKRLSALFATLRGVDTDFSRNPSAGRPVNL